MYVCVCPDCACVCVPGCAVICVRVCVGVCVRACVCPYVHAIYEMCLRVWLTPRCPRLPPAGLSEPKMSGLQALHANTRTYVQVPRISPCLSLDLGCFALVINLTTKRCLLVSPSLSVLRLFFSFPFFSSSFQWTSRFII